MKRLFLPAALCLIAAAAIGAEAVTVPVGFMKISIAAGSAGAPKLTSFSLPLRETAESEFVGRSAGLIASAGSATVTVTNAGWTPGALSQAASPYFLRIKSGEAVGRTFQISTASNAQNTADTVTLLTEGSDLGVVGVSQSDKFEIFPADTLLSLFGPGTLDGNQSVLAGGPTTADLVRVMEGGTWNEYHYNLSANQWQRTSAPVSRNNVVLRPDRGVLYVRRATTSFDMTLTGVVPDTNLKMVYNPLGGTFLATGFPVDQTLLQLGYQSLSGWVSKTAANSIGDTDKIQVFDGLIWNQYHFDSVASQWRRSSAPVNMNNKVVNAGSPVLVEKRSGSPGTAVMSRPIPYNLN